MNSFATLSPIGKCIQEPDSKGPDGLPVANGYFHSPFLNNASFVATAIYRDGRGRIVGADSLALNHRWIAGKDTHFQIPRTLHVSDISSAELFCKITAVNN